jgi:hypothetical protein
MYKKHNTTCTRNTIQQHVQEQRYEQFSSTTLNKSENVQKKYTLIWTSLLLSPLAVNFPLDATASGLRVTKISTSGQYPEVLGLI